MILLNSASKIQIVTGSAAKIEVNASYVELTAGAVTALGPINVPHITTATTTDLAAPTATPAVAASPASGTTRNIKHLNITNDHASVSCQVAVDHTDGTTVIELISVLLMPGENLVFTETGEWRHHDANGAEYPPAGLGSYAGRSVDFFKVGTAMEGSGYWYSTSKDPGFPGAWSPGTPGMAGRATDGTTTADAGCALIQNPATGANYLTEFVMGGGVNHANKLVDVLWVNSGTVITTTTAQTVNSVALPARDINGTTNGVGCGIAILCTAAVGLAANASNATISYTNSDGTAGRTATLSAVVGSQAPISPVIGTWIFFNLQAGDKGVQSIQSITLNTTWVSGSISLIIYRHLKNAGGLAANAFSPGKIEGAGVRLYNGTCALHVALASATTATFFTGELVIQEK